VSEPGEALEARPAGAVAVLGGGSWGTALALLLARNGQRPRLWARDPAQVAAMRRERRNRRYLPDFSLDPSIALTGDAAEAVRGARDLLLAVPSHAFRDALERIAPQLAPDARVAWATKGFAGESADGGAPDAPRGARLLHELVAEALGEEVPAAVLSGPTFAAEVAAGLPTAVTVASAHPGFAADLSARLHDSRFRVYTSDDLVGVEVGGAVKNVLAIAAGIADGLGFGANARAALITRGLVELMRLGVALGGRRETFMGLAGLGDLVLTCTDDLSRNRRVGLALGRGESLDAALGALGQVAEGVRTAAEVMRLARRLGVEMPICEQVARVLHRGVAPADAVQALLERAARDEKIP